MIRNLTLAILSLAMVTLAAMASADDSNSAPPEPAEMQSLFSGKELDGWDGDPRLWSVKDGVIHGETTAEKPAKGNTFLIWKKGTLKDFDLRLSFRCNATNNSGIQYRSKHITEGNPANAWVVRGYQHEIRNEKKLPSVAGFIYDEGGRRGRVCLVGEKAVWGADGKKQVTEKLIDAAGYEKLFKLDNWNDVVIIARGNRIQHYLNGTLILDFTDDDSKLALREGVLALQLHGGNPMWAEFKNIRLKKLGMTAGISSAELLAQNLLQAGANEDFSEAALQLRDGSQLCFCHRVGERWAKAFDAPASADPIAQQETASLAGKLLAAIKIFRLNAKHLDIQFADGSRWDKQIPTAKP